jgi:NADH-quinone oxidoreductase subunit J
MIEPRTILSLSTVLGAAGLWLLLPRGAARTHLAGAAFALAALGAWASQVPGLGDWLSNSLFLLLAATTIVAAAATVTCRSPVYSAIWFGMTLAGTAGLFLLAGAEFLAVATLVVYAGAILVTFLFVLMLAQPEGRTSYDRRSWEALLSAAAGAFLIGVLSMTIAAVLTQPSPLPPGEGPQAVPGVRAAATPYAPQVEQLGTELFTQYLVPVEVVGTLLLAALVGAAVIIAQGRMKQRPQGPSSE